MDTLPHQLHSFSATGATGAAERPRVAESNHELPAFSRSEAFAEDLNDAPQPQPAPRRLLALFM